MKYIVIAAAVAVLAGCADLRDSFRPAAQGGSAASAQFVSRDCGRDWHEVGQRDGRLAATGQGELYAAACSSFDTARFQQGWADGYAQRPSPTGN